MNFKKHFIFLPLTLFFFSCENPVADTIFESKEVPVSTELEKETQVDSTEIIIEKLRKSLINNMNVTQKLTEFGKLNKENHIIMYTNYGKMKFKLYNNTPLHRANIVMLAKKKFYDNTTFYRVINNFMIQGGNAQDEDINWKMKQIGAYRIPNEINKVNLHKKGAIAMAVPEEEQNFEKKSSAVDFYIIEGRKISNSYFQTQKNKKKKFSDRQKSIYKKVGGAPHLDGYYTVFGEIVSGWNTLSKISNVKTDTYDYPKKEILIDSIRAF